MNVKDDRVEWGERVRQYTEAAVKVRQLAEAATDRQVRAALVTMAQELAIDGRAWAQRMASEGL